MLSNVTKNCDENLIVKHFQWKKNPVVCSEYVFNVYIFMQWFKLPVIVDLIFLICQLVKDKC